MSSTPGGRRRARRSRSSGCPGGLVSNWLLDHVADGDEVEVTFPAGVFCLQPGDRDVVGFAGGQRHHAGALAAQGGPGDHRPSGAPARTPTATPPSTIFAAELDAPRGRARRAPRGGRTTSTSIGASSTPTPCAGFLGERRRRRRLRVRTDAVHGHRRGDAARRRRRPPSGSTSSGSPPAAPVEVARVGARAVTAAPAGHDRARRQDRQHRAPPRHHDPADGPPDRHGAAVLVRGGQLRHLHGAAGRGRVHDVRQQRARPTTRWPKGGS